MSEEVKETTWTYLITFLVAKYDNPSTQVIEIAGSDWKHMSSIDKVQRMRVLVAQQLNKKLGLKLTSDDIYLQKIVNLDKLFE